MCSLLFAEFAEKEIKIQTYKSKEYFNVVVLRLAEGRNFPQNRQYYFLWLYLWLCNNTRRQNCVVTNKKRSKLHKQKTTTWHEPPSLLSNFMLHDNYLSSKGPFFEASIKYIFISGITKSQPQSSELLLISSCVFYFCLLPFVQKQSPCGPYRVVEKNVWKFTAQWTPNFLSLFL